MTRIVLILLIIFPTVANAQFNRSNCTYNGIKLYGTVQVVNSFPDIKVEISSFPDLKVQEVTAFPNSCGQWQYVTSFPDFKVQFVTSFGDIKVQKVSSFPRT